MEGINIDTKKITNKKLTFCASLIAIASIIGFLENLFPLPFLQSLPGIKLGFANIVVLFAYETLGKKYAFLVAFVKPFLIFLFSGNVFSLFLSFSGGMFAFLALLIFYRFCNKICTFIGISALSAVFHIFGQMIMSIILLKTVSFFYLIPVLSLFSAITGVITGFIMNFIIPKLKKIIL